MLRALIIAATLTATPLIAQDAEPAMTLERMAEIVLALDADASITGNGFELSISDVPVLIIADARANRMRAMVPISSVEGMTFLFIL